MEFFESQVGEVRSLMGAPGGSTVDSALGINSAPAPLNSASAAVAETPDRRASSSSKRKHSDDAEALSPSARGNNGPQQRSKRNRYISIACNECKRRKIKCNGQTPCQRCGNLNLQCLYATNCCSSTFKDSQEYKDMSSQVSQLQEQVQTLFDSMNSIRSETCRLAPIQQDRPLLLPSAASTPSTTSAAPTIPPLHQTDLSQFRQPTFRGPTSTHFSLDVAKNTLHKMGYSNMVEGPDEPITAPESPPAASPMFAPQPQATSYFDRQPPDPLWEFDKNEMVRLCRLHEEEIGIQYPVIKIETMVNHAKALATWMEAAKNNGLVPNHGQDGGINDLNTMMLKIVMACALTVEEHGYSERGHRLFESLRPVVDRMLTSEPSDLKVMPLLALTAGYRWLTNDEILSWRLMGMVSRLCMELGLHRRETVMKIEDESERRYVIHTFWSAYVLDRRWSFSVGLPWAVPDEDVDPDLPYPEGSPFLTAMITYSKLSARVWRLVRNFDPNMNYDLQPHDIKEIDHKIKQWYTQLPKDTQLDLGDWEALPRYLNPPAGHQKEYDIQRLQIWTWLRLNQIRIWLYTPILHTHSSIMENVGFASLVVKLARNTIKYLSHLNNTTNIYRKCQVFYHQFLTSAITVLFLASCHAPVNFSAACRDEFYLALELVKDMSAKSWVSKRLWSTIKSLKEVAPRLGLSEDPHSTAALTMAGLATGHHHNNLVSSSAAPATSAPFAKSTTAVAPVPAAVDGTQISNEMSKIFEGYMGMNNGMANPSGAHSTFSPPAPPTTSVSSLTVGPSSSSSSSSIVVEEAGTNVAATATAAGFGVGSVYQHFRNMF